MDITQFLQSTWISRRTIIRLLQHWWIQKNWENISYRKEPVISGDEIVVQGEKYIVTWDNNTFDIILFHKPMWYVVSKDDIHNDTIFALLPSGREKTYHYIGRLDKDSHWLLVLTNATKLVSFFSHPRYNHDKVYHVTIDRNLSQQDIQKGMVWVSYYDEDEQKNVMLSRKSCTFVHDTTYAITISEWKKRHIRRLLNALEYTVYELCRVRFAWWELWDIPSWKREKITISSWDVESLLENGNSYTQKQI